MMQDVSIHNDRGSFRVRSRSRMNEPSNAIALDTCAVLPFEVSAK